MKREISSAEESYFKFGWLKDGNEMSQKKSEVPPRNFEPDIPTLRKSFKRVAPNSESLVKQNKELQEQLILVRGELIEQRENLRKMNANELDRISKQFENKIGETTQQNFRL